MWYFEDIKQHYLVSFRSSYYSLQPDKPYSVLESFIDHCGTGRTTIKVTSDSGDTVSMTEEIFQGLGGVIESDVPSSVKSSLLEFNSLVEQMTDLRKQAQDFADEKGLSKNVYVQVEDMYEDTDWHDSNC